MRFYETKKYFFENKTKFDLVYWLIIFKVTPSDHPLADTNMDIIIGAEGKRVTLPGFRSINLENKDENAHIYAIKGKRYIYIYIEREREREIEKHTVMKETHGDDGNTL